MSLEPVMIPEDSYSLLLRIDERTRHMADQVTQLSQDVQTYINQNQAYYASVQTFLQSLPALIAQQVAAAGAADQDAAQTADANLQTAIGAIPAPPAFTPATPSTKKK